MSYGAASGAGPLFSVAGDGLEVSVDGGAYGQPSPDETEASRVFGPQSARVPTAVAASNYAYDPSDPLTSVGVAAAAPPAALLVACNRLYRSPATPAMYGMDGGEGGGGGGGPASVRPAFLGIAVTNATDECIAAPEEVLPSEPSVEQTDAASESNNATTDEANETNDNTTAEAPKCDDEAATQPPAAPTLLSTRILKQWSVASAWPRTDSTPGVDYPSMLTTSVLIVTIRRMMIKSRATTFKMKRNGKA